MGESLLALGGDMPLTSRINRAQNFLFIF